VVRKVRRGLSLPGALMGIFVVSVAVSVGGLVSVASVKAVRSYQRRAVALWAACGALERLRGERPKWLSRSGRKELGRLALPGGRLHVVVGREVAPGVREVRVVATWRDPAGPRRRVEVWTLLRAGE